MYAEARSYKNYERLTAEVAALKSESVRGHPNIVQLEGICWEVQLANNLVLPVLVFEKADYGNLREYMAAEGMGADFNTKAQWCADLAGALHSLHVNGKTCHELVCYSRVGATEALIGIVHGDLKPANVLVFKSRSGNSTVKITDFGSAEYSGNKIKLPHTWPWYAPEWHPRTFTLAQAKKADIYTLGMLCLWTMFAKCSTETGAFVADAPAVLTPPDESSDRQIVDGLKQRDELPTFVDKLLAQQPPLPEAEQTRLKAFFRCTTRFDPQARQLDLIQLSRLLVPQRYVLY
jgi:serine/threonine protein kinase